MFAEVELLDGNKLYQLRSELRHPATKNAKELKTAKIKLSEGVTRRELGMVLNNHSAFEVVEPKAEIDFQALNANQAIAVIGQLNAQQLSEVRAEELAGKKRKSVLDSIDAALEGLESTSDWRDIAIADLKIAKATIATLTEAKITTIGAVQVFIDENEGLELEGLTDEMVNELLTAIKEQIK